MYESWGNETQIGTKRATLALTSHSEVSTLRLLSLMDCSSDESRHHLSAPFDLEIASLNSEQLDGEDEHAVRRDESACAASSVGQVRRDGHLVLVADGHTHKNTQKHTHGTSVNGG